MRSVIHWPLVHAGGIAARCRGGSTRVAPARDWRSSRACARSRRSSPADRCTPGWTGANRYTSANWCMREKRAVRALVTGRDEPRLRGDLAAAPPGRVHADLVDAAAPGVERDPLGVARAALVREREQLAGRELAHLGAAPARSRPALRGAAGARTAAGARGPRATGFRSGADPGGSSCREASLVRGGRGRIAQRETIAIDHLLGAHGRDARPGRDHADQVEGIHRGEAYRLAGALHPAGPAQRLDGAG